MYIPAFNEEQHLPTLFSLITRNPLGMWTTLVDGKIEINHIPFVLHENRGAFGTLVGHVARANPVWRRCARDTPSVVVFQGEQAYISPSWYSAKQAHGKVVPTWNYAVVHAQGIPAVIDDPEWLLAHVAELTRIHERGRPQPWDVTDAPAEFIEKVLGAIVGIEIPISQLTGKWKLGQNRPASDRPLMMEGLKSIGCPRAQAMAEQLQQYFNEYSSRRCKENDKDD